jgi:hypothetical protein
MEVLIYQTGKAREVASSDPAVLNKETELYRGGYIQASFFTSYC